MVGRTLWLALLAAVRSRLRVSLWCCIVVLPAATRTLQRATPQLLEVNSSPDLGLVAGQFPAFLDDAFTALFLPHERLPATFSAV